MGSPTIFGSSSIATAAALDHMLMTADATTSTRTTLLLQFEWRPALSPRRHSLYPSPYNLNVSICLGLCSRCCHFCCICHVAAFLQQLKLPVTVAPMITLVQPPQWTQSSALTSPSMRIPPLPNQWLPVQYLLCPAPSFNRPRHVVCSCNALGKMNLGVGAYRFCV